jgi:hypothetical protein
MERKMDTSSPPEEPGRGFEFDKKVSYEDILAARVFRKALGAQAFVFFLIVGVLAYVGFDLKSKSASLREAQASLAAKQASLQSRIDSANGLLAVYQRQMEDRVGEADRIVKTADGVVGSANAYQQALAGQLLSFGQLQQHTLDLQNANAAMLRQVEGGMGDVQRTVAASSSQRQRDSAALTSTIDYVSRTTRGLSSTILQVVEEDSPTPIGNSEFTLEFDDLVAHGCMITGVKLQHARADVPGWPRPQMMVGVPEELPPVDGHRYRLTVVQGYSRHGKVMFFLATSRVLVRLEKIDDLTALTGESPKPDSISRCEPISSDAPAPARGGIRLASVLPPAARAAVRARIP